MKKKLKAALYSPYLDILGGGERHILSIMLAVEKLGYRISIFWDRDLSTDFEKRLGLRFDEKPAFLPNIFKTKLNFVQKALALRPFDLFFYVTDGSYFFSSAKKNFVFAMVPDRKLYSMNKGNWLKTINFQFISNSRYTQKLLESWGVKSRLIYPYVADEIIKAKPEDPKEKIILSVGRFFGHLHSKNQDKVINAFKKLKRQYPLFKDFKLILAGGLKEEDKSYYKNLQKMIGDDQSIQLMPNIDTKQLIDIYKKSDCFWHFAGFGVDQARFPEKVEHLGLTPLEAMATGNITFCYRAGGPEEIIQDGQNGFLFKTEEELFEKMLSVCKDKNRQKLIRINAEKFVVDNFSRPVFFNRVKNLI